MNIKLDNDFFKHPEIIRIREKILEHDVIIFAGRRWLKDAEIHYRATFRERIDPEDNKSEIIEVERFATVSQFIVWAVTKNKVIKAENQHGTVTIYPPV